MLLRCLSDRGPKTEDRRLETRDRKPETGDRGPGTDWSAIVDLAVGEHVAPLLFKRLKDNDARDCVPADAWKRLRRAYFNSSDRNTRLFRELTTVLQRLRSSGIKVIVLKGAYLAETVYGDVALRPMCDNDLMVPRVDLARAEAVLLDLGGAPEQIKDTESRRRERHHAPPVIIHDLAIELHWTIVSPTGPVRIDAAGLWNRARPASIAGVETLALSPEDLLLHLCLHFCYKDACVGLRSLCDIAETIQHFGGEMNPEVRHGTTEVLARPRGPQPNPVEPQMNADGHRLSPESNPILVSTRTAFASGCQELGVPRTEVAERNIVAETTILHACSTGSRRVRSEPRPSPISVFSVSSVVEPVSVPGIDWQQVVERAREWGATRHVGLALHLAESLLGAGVPDDILERLVPEGIDPRVLEAARETVLTQTARHHWESLFRAQGARSPGEKAKFLRERVFLSRDEMAEKYPASRGSRFFYLYYALRLRDGIRAYSFHALRRTRLMMQRRRRERYAALHNWLTRP
jgi:hypothetical protein